MRPNRSITSLDRGGDRVVTGHVEVEERHTASGVTREVLRPVPTTSKPAATNARAVSLPMPEDAPVTSATGRFVVITNSLHH